MQVNDIVESYGMLAVSDRELYKLVGFRSDTIDKDKVKTNKKFKAILEIARRHRLETLAPTKRISNSRHIYEEFYFIQEFPHEEFWLLLMSHRNVVRTKIMIGKGGMESVVVDPKILIKHILENNSTTIAVVHNHPSGEIKPSQEDKNITERIAQICKLIQIRFIDHLIIGKNSYYSFADDNLL